MSFAVAPEQVPFAPRPFREELISSWLIRVASANYVSLDELLAGLACRHPGAVFAESIDYSLPENAIAAISHFCRVPAKVIREMTIACRAPKQSPGLLLRFQFGDRSNDRSWRIRARYAWCPACLSEQTIIHANWEWALAFLLRCPVHHVPLLEGCPSCERHDPIRFQDNDPFANCRFCQESLIAAVGAEDDPIDAASIQQIQFAYRTAILGEAPTSSLFGKASDRQFRLFVEDLLQFLAWGFGPYDDSSGTEGHPSLSRHDRLRVVYELILNTAPCPAPRARRRRVAEGIKLWTALLQTLPNFRAKQIEEASLRWPLAIRRRFTAALRLRIRARWPYEPFAPAQLSLRLKCKLLAPFRLNTTF